MLSSRSIKANTANIMAERTTNFQTFLWEIPNENNERQI